MNTTTDELPLWNSSTDDPLQRSPIEWVSRCYESSEQWKQKAREVFLSVNGESNVARNRVAALVRDYFIALPTEPEAVRRWKKGSNEVETILMQPPKVSTSNAAYFDWVHIADFLLLACASPNLESSENQTRDNEYRSVLESFRIRNIVFHARRELVDKPAASDEDILASLRSAHPTVALAHVKEARRLNRSGTPNREPVEPPPPSPVPLFVPIYFRG
ncbi:MAG: hypothetical protein DWH91_02545 [Planctomycetota bacterium]|nr:MAG: hypothetical protein DWH91_02545 [Planctomycetota bacterium]